MPIVLQSVVARVVILVPEGDLGTLPSRDATGDDIWIPVDISASIAGRISVQMTADMTRSEIATLHDAFTALLSGANAAISFAAIEDWISIEGGFEGYARRLVLRVKLCDHSLAERPALELSMDVDVSTLRDSLG